VLYITAVDVPMIEADGADALRKPVSNEEFVDASHSRDDRSAKAGATLRLGNAMPAAALY
jgi:hypothetical protein